MNSKNITFGIIIIIVILNSVGMAIALPLLPFIVGKYLYPEQVVYGVGGLIAVYSMSSFLSAPVFGALSDRFGRKGILLISLLGSVIGFVLFAIGGNIYILFLGRIIDGLTAGNISTLFAYISDITDPSERVKRYGHIGGAMGIGKIGGPALGGLIGLYSIQTPFYITAGLILLSCFAVYFFLPESLDKDKRTKAISLNTMNTFVHFKGVLTIKRIRSIIFTGLLFYIGIGIFQINFTIFLKDVFRYDSLYIGLLFTLIGVVEIFSRSVILPKMLKKYNNKTIARIGLSILVCGLFLTACSAIISSLFIIATAIMLIILGEGLFEPIYTGELASTGEISLQGKVQGVNQSIQSMMNMILPILVSFIYYPGSGRLYLLAGGAVFVALFRFDN